MSSDLLEKFKRQNSSSFFNRSNKIQPLLDNLYYLYPNQAQFDMIAGLAWRPRPV
jgi:hypothetical protein